MGGCQGQSPVLGQDWCSVASHAADVAMAMELQRQVGAGSPSSGVDAAFPPGGLAAGPAAGAARWFCEEFREQMDPADAQPWAWEGALLVASGWLACLPSPRCVWSG